MWILDFKSVSDQELLVEFSVWFMFDFFGEGVVVDFWQVQVYLSDWGVLFDFDLSIVCGLDYYCCIVWEFYYEGIGVKLVLGGGGCYDGLSE